MTQPTLHPARVRSTVTAIPCGSRHGSPITERYTYNLARDPEPFGSDPATGRAKSRLWIPCGTSARHGMKRTTPGAVVWTDTIIPAEATA